MFGRADNLEIFDAVVHLITIEMVNVFAGKKSSTDFEFHNVPMLADGSSADTNDFIRLSGIGIFSLETIKTHFEVFTRTTIATARRWRRFATTAWMGSFHKDSYVTRYILA